MGMIWTNSACLYYEHVHMRQLWCSDWYIIPRWRAWRFVSRQRHPQMRRTPGYPESMHCYESFCTESAPHAAAVVRPRRRPAQKHRNSHLTPHQPKRRRMSDPELLEDTASPPARHVPVRATSTRVGVAGKEPAAATYAAHLLYQAPPPRTHAAT
jgi:hypothetical protein